MLMAQAKKLEKPSRSMCRYGKHGPGSPMTTAPPAMPPATAPMGTPADLEVAVGGEGGSTATGLGLLTAGTVMTPGKPATTTSTFTLVRLMFTPAPQVSRSLAQL
jgi:hypothetical protein